MRLGTRVVVGSRVEMRSEGEGDRVGMLLLVLDDRLLLLVGEGDVTVRWFRWSFGYPDARRSTRGCGGRGECGVS